MRERRPDFFEGLMRGRMRHLSIDLRKVVAVAFSVGFLMLTLPVQGQEAARKYHAPAVVPLQGKLDLAAAKSFERRLERANEAKSDLILVDIDVASGTAEGARVT